MFPSAGRQRGVTLIELIVFIVVVSIALAGVLQVLRLTSANSADPLRRKQALMIAESLLEEVQMAAFTYCDPSSDNADSATDTAACTVPEGFGQAGTEPVGARPFDNVNDYAAAPNQPAAAFDVAGALADAGGTPLPLQGYTARVTLVPEDLGGIAANSSVTDVGEVLRISVAVSYDDQTLVLDGYRTRYAPVTGP